MDFPQAFLQNMRAQLGEAEYALYLAAMAQPFTRGLRVNLLRYPDGTLPLSLDGVEEAIPWARGGFFVRFSARPGLHPLHEGGAYYLQEPSAMAAVSALDVRPGQRVLDLCASPGGKSTQIACLLGGQGLLVANEPVPARAQVLSRNVERMGVRNAVVLSALPDALAPRFPAFFDRVLVDAPCSGEGMFRRQEEARAEWTPQSPAGCAGRQLEILSQACRMLRPGGLMVYSTCTFNTVENEGVIAQFLSAHPDFSPESFSLPGLCDAPEGMAHLYPHRMRGEGHFCARLRRSPDAPAAPETFRGPCRAGKDRGRTAAPAWGPALDACLSQVLSPASAPRKESLLAGAVAFGDALYAQPEGLPDLSGLRVLRAGLLLGRVAGKRVEPDHALAMALREEDALNVKALSEEQALRFQHGEALRAGEDAQRGFTLMTLYGCPLGFAKCSDGLYKNHYPKGLRR